MSREHILHLAATMAPTAALDFETTGLDVNSGHRVVEVGVVRVDPQTNTRVEWSTLVNPGVPISKRTQEIHGISNEMVEDAPLFAQALPQFAHLIEDCVLIAHNANFDLGFLRIESRRAKQQNPTPAVVVDTLALARHVFRLPSCSLSSVSQRIGLPHHDAHRALADARATMAIYHAMLAHLALNDSAPTVHDLCDVIQKASQERGHANIRALLEEASEHSPTVDIDYTSYKNDGQLSTRRRVTILTLRKKKLDAYCHLRQARRTFRLDRIIRVAPAPAAVLPEGIRRPD